MPKSSPTKDATMEDLNQELLVMELALDDARAAFAVLNHAVDAAMRVCDDACKANSMLCLMTILDLLAQGQVECEIRLTGVAHAPLPTPSPFCDMCGSINVDRKPDYGRCRTCGHQQIY